jgi:hypothetical protein
MKRRRATGVGREAWGRVQKDKRQKSQDKSKNHINYKREKLSNKKVNVI